MLSELAEAMIVNGVVLATVLASDLGPARKIGPLRLLRPLVAAAVIIPLFVSRPVTHGARAAFSYGAGHWFTAQIVSWAIASKVTEAAITDGLIFMAIVMVLARTVGLGARASRLAAGTTAPASAAQDA
jgi:preprotein translocase subunit SecG